MGGNMTIGKKENLTLFEAAMKDSIDIENIFINAFSDDPVLRWISPNASLSRFIFRIAVPEMLASGQIKITEGRSGAIAVSPPRKHFSPKFTFDRVFRYLKYFGTKSSFRFLKMLYLEQKNSPKSKHYYVFSLGTRSEHRKQGIGSALLNQVLERADREHVLTYLENSNRANIPFYERHGFEIRNCIDLDANGTCLWFMYREAQ